jgi:hypothetical protein
VTSWRSTARCSGPSRAGAAFPDIDRWAGVVADLLAPGGRLFMREGHPVLHALAEPLPGGLLALEQSGTLASPVWSGYAMGTTCRHHCEGKPTHGVLTARTAL